MLKSYRLALLGFFALHLLTVSLSAWSAAITQDSTADHSKFAVLKKDFKTAPEVTAACLECHTEAAQQLHKTKHWLWQFTHPATGQTLGKRTLINSFCGAISSNYARCTSCHIGYGWKDDRFDFTSEINVDCLVCHDTTGTYQKFPTDAGHPAYQDKPFPADSQILWKAPHLMYVAQNVGKTSRQTCGACHFYGGGGDGVKHGDIDSSLLKPDKKLDVHMGMDSLDFSCATCHMRPAHDIQGSRYTITAKDAHGVDVPGRDDQHHATCESCHGVTPHDRHINNKLNEHAHKVACETCHIPSFARGNVPSKMWWDWSTAGQMDENGKPMVKKNAQGEIEYDSKKGSFTWDKNIQPEYAWYSGNIRYRQLHEKLNPNEVVALNDFAGSYNDPNARIWPFKVMRGKQPYDKGNNTLVIMHLFGKDQDAYWQGFDWKTAIQAGMDSANAAFSGDYGFIETTMHWPLAHTVAPKEEALACEACHSQNGRLQKLSGFYMPGRDRNNILDTIGWLVVLASLVGVLLHGLGRMVVAKKQGHSNG